MKGRRAAFLLGALALVGSGRARAADADLAGALVAALPADGRTDVVLIEQPSRPGAPRVRAVTRVNAAPAAVRAALLDTAHYGAVIPALVQAEARPGDGQVPFVDWELEVPLFNLSGRFALRAAGDQVRLDLFDGDFSPGHLVFTIRPAAGGGTTLLVDATMDMRRSSWILRRILKQSPFAEPAGVAAAAYVAVRAIALRAEHPGDSGAWRPSAPPAPPPAWQPDAGEPSAPGLAAARAAGVVAFVARRPDGRLAGVVAALGMPSPAPAVESALRDPRAWRAFPGWRKVDLVPGARGPGARVEDNLPLMDFDATWAMAEPPLRWTVVDGATRGARLGWTVRPDGARAATVALSLYPRLEKTGSVARRFLAAEPLLESGLALAVTFAGIASTRAALGRAP
ncbi:MAG TPA: hypothetical protein VN962_15995 [Polyangia bacterium]|nr:hypothetical protein [Polyangia bacterium]